MKKTLLILAPLILSGCALLTPSSKRVEIKTVEVQKVVPLQPAPKALQLNDVTWYVVTAENYEEFKEKFEKENASLVFFAISVPDYENMALNMAELKRYILQQEQIVVYYEKAVTPSQQENKK